MVKKVKRFLVFMLFSFFYSLLAGKEAEAAGKVCLVPKTESGNLKYNGKEVPQTDAAALAANLCDDSGY